MPAERFDASRMLTARVDSKARVCAYLNGRLS
jgi:hypothetical protein